MSDLLTVLVFAAILMGFGFAATIGAKPEGARVTIGAIMMVSGLMLAVGMTVLSFLAIFITFWYWFA